MSIWVLRAYSNVFSSTIGLVGYELVELARWNIFFNFGTVKAKSLPLVHCAHVIVLLLHRTLLCNVPLYLSCLWIPCGLKYVLYFAQAMLDWCCMHYFPCCTALCWLLIHRYLVLWQWFMSDELLFRWFVCNLCCILVLQVVLLYCLLPASVACWSTCFLAPPSLSGFVSEPPIGLCFEMMGNLLMMTMMNKKADTYNIKITKNN